MKKVLLILLMSMMMIPAIAQDEAPLNAVAIDPIWLLLNTYKGSYERRIFDQVSAQVEVSYSPDFFWGLHEYESLTYLDVIVEGRYYFGSLLKTQASDVNLGGYQTYLTKIFTDALGGLYVGVFGGYVNSIVEDGKDTDYFKGSFNGFGGGLEVGCKYIFGERNISFFLEPYGILQVYGGSYSYEDENGDKLTSKPNGFEDGFNRTGFSGGLNFGMTF